MRPPSAIITKARARLLVRAPFIGSIALGLAWVNAPDIGTMATDGRSIWFNPAWCEAHGVEKTMAVIAHEVFHIVNRHHLRRGERDAVLWNIAGDLLINRLLEDDKYVLPSDGLFDRDRRYTGLPVEIIYARLLEQRRQQAEQPRDRQSTNEPSPGRGSGSGSGPDTTSDHADQREAHNGNGVFPARQWGEVRDLTKSNGQCLSPTDTAPCGARSRCPDSPSRSGSKAGGQVRHRAAGDGRDRDRPRGLARQVPHGLRWRTARRGELGPAEPRFIQHGIIRQAGGAPGPVVSASCWTRRARSQRMNCRSTSRQCSAFWRRPVPKR